MDIKKFERKLAQCVPYIMNEGTEWSEGMRTLFDAANESYLSDETREVVLDLLRKEIVEGLRDWWFDAGYEWEDIKHTRRWAWKKTEEELAKTGVPWYSSLSNMYANTLIDVMEERR